MKAKEIIHLRRLIRSWKKTKLINEKLFSLIKKDIETYINLESK